MIKRVLFILKNIVINQIRSVLPFSVLKFFFRRKMTGRGRRLTNDEILETYANIFLRFYKALKENNLKIEGELIEIGPGSNFYLALGFLATGCQKVTAVDRFPFISNQVDISEISRYLDILQQKNLPVVELDASKMLSRIHYIKLEDFISDPPKNVQLIYSNSVLEHIHDLPKALKIWRNCLDSDGYMLHWVDFKSHGTFLQTELDFLTIQQTIWNMMSSNRGLINRQRWMQHKRMLNSEGWEVVWDQKTKYPNNKIEEFRKMYPGYVNYTDSDLKVSRCFYLCKFE